MIKEPTPPPHSTGLFPMTVLRKFIFSFLGMGLLISFAIYYSHSIGSEVDESVDTLVHVNIEEIAAASEIAYQVQRIKSNIRELMLEKIIAPEESEVSHAHEVIMAMLEQVNSVGTRLKENIEEDLAGLVKGSEEWNQEYEEIEEVGELLEVLEEFSKSTHIFLTKFEENPEDVETYHHYFEDELEPLSRTLQDLIDEMRSEALEEARDEGVEFHEKLSQSHFVTIYSMLFALVGSLLIGSYLARNLTIPLRTLSQSMARVDEGDLDERADISSKDELGALATNFNKMVDTIQANFKQLNEADKELRTLNLELEARVEQRTASLKEAKLEAEVANQSKSAFLANMSHEIRTPMNGVVGMLDVLTHSRMSDDDRKMVDTISHSAHSLLGIINDILDFSKIEAGKLGLSESPIRVEHEFDAVCNLLDRVALDKQVELTMFFDPEIPEMLVGDALRLRQILTNLTNNALKFSSGLDHIGRVYLRAELAKRDNDRVWVQFSITDNGIGIDEKTKARLFQPFEQAQGGTTRAYGGTGLGLVISQNLAELMGGAIEVESQVGEGSTFTVCLPFTIGDEDRTTTLPYDLTDLETVVVCDDPKYVDDYIRYLTHAGAKAYSVEELENGWDLIREQSLAEPICMMVMEEPGLKTAQEIVDRLVANQPDKDVRLVQVVYLSIERGRRRHARVLAENVIQIDREVLTRRRLLNAVALSTGRITIEEMVEEKPDYIDQPQPQTREDAIAAGRLILVAEDNETNLEVIQRQLNLLGFTADLSKDGVEAFAKWQSGDYGLLLTDLHMPNRDGYDLTTLIRQMEHEQKTERIPIIALTANALKGEEERCLEIGMDGYLSKPVKLNLLRDTLQQWLPNADEGVELEPDEQSSQDTEPEESNNNKGQAVDPSILTQIVGDDPALHKQFLEKFVGPASQTITEIHAAFEAGSAEQIGELGHKLKSSSRTIGANALADLCAELEVAGKADDWSRIKTLHSHLDMNFGEVKTFIENH